MTNGFTPSPWYEFSPRLNSEADREMVAAKPAGVAPGRPGGAPLPGHVNDDGQATATLIAAKLITLCRSAGAGDTGLVSFLDDLLVAVTARLDCPADHSDTPVPRLMPWQEAAAKKLMTQDLTCPPSLHALATACGMSVNAFAKAFRGATGLSPRQWLISHRIARAQEMLVDSTVPLSVVALDCGFCDQSHFTRSFTQTVGKTPAVWRRETRLRGAPTPPREERPWPGRPVLAAE